MKIKLTDIPVFYINLDEAEEKRKQTETMLKQIGFKFVERFSAIRHDAGRIIGCARSHYEILEVQKPPFIILEDDCALNQEFLDEIEIPNNADALYLGISHWGRYLSHSGPYVHATKVNEDLVRVHNMLATHAIVYLSSSYVDICRRIAYHSGYESETHLDIGFAEIHKYYNVYCFNEPLFRQYEWNGVTTGNLLDVCFDKNTADSLFDAIQKDDSNFYKLNDTFKSPFKSLIEKRDVNGIPGYFLPTKIL